jgi:hypothetical protein
VSGNIKEKHRNMSGITLDKHRNVFLCLSWVMPDTFLCI